MPLATQPAGTARQQLKDLLNCWGDDAAIKGYMQDKIKARYELVLFIEHIPYALDQWLPKHPGSLQACLGELCSTIAFLASKGIIHFDAHFKNVLTDGRQIYLTDFGLALDQSFDLSPAEQTFYDQNLGYDYAEIALNIGHLVISFYNSCPEQNKRKIQQKYGLAEDLKPHQLRAILLDNLEQIQADGTMELDPFLLNSLIKCREIIHLMHTFLANLRSHDQKNTKFPQEKLMSLLKESGFP